MSNDIEQFYGVRTVAEVEKALLWQYNNAPKLQSLIDQKEAWLSRVNTEFWCWYLFNYFFLGDSTDEDGVTIWSILLGYGISAGEPANITDVWGFGVDDEQFDQAGFGNHQSGVITLPLEWAIFALRLRYFQLTTSATVTQINTFMNYLMGFDGTNINAPQIYVVDNLDMTISYQLNFTPDQFLRFIIDNLDLLPRPAGVEIIDVAPVNPLAWGFGVDDEQFDEAGFGA